jgi:hypothetical protein
MKPDSLPQQRDYSDSCTRIKIKNHCFQLEGDVQNFPSGIKHSTLNLRNLTKMRKGVGYEIRFAYILTDNWSGYPDF